MLFSFTEQSSSTIRPLACTHTLQSHTVYIRCCRRALQHTNYLHQLAEKSTTTSPGDARRVLNSFMSVMVWTVMVYSCFVLLVSLNVVNAMIRVDAPQQVSCGSSTNAFDNLLWIMPGSFSWSHAWGRARCMKLAPSKKYCNRSESRAALVYYWYVRFRNFGDVIAHILQQQSPPLRSFISQPWKIVELPNCSRA
jgi:hypothetical protein